ncbi:GumC family protein [Roseibium aquae]|uniref:GumC family protein n=1 Tax=Roseibium aquae TaxID=1323746 RepID=UPI00123E2C63|nr:GumC family protein [Roseibium aquae]
MSDIRQDTDQGQQAFLGLVEMIKALRARFWLVALCGFLFAGITAAVSLTLTPVYQATARILIDPSVRQPFEDRAIPSRVMTDAFGVDSQVEVIRSSTILEQVVLSQNLIEDPEFGINAQPTGLSALLAPFLGSSDETSNQDATSKTIDALRKALDVKRAGQTFVINVSVQSRSAEKAAILANAIAESYTADQERRNSTQGLRVQEQVVDRLSSIRQRLREAEDEVERYKAANNLQATSDNATVSSQELAIVAERLSQERATLAAAEAKAQEIERLIDAGASPDISGDATSSSAITALREQFTLAARNEANLAANLLPSHPSLVEARAQVQQVRRLIEEEVQRIAASARLEADVARDRVLKVENELDRARAMANEASRSRVELQELEIEAEAIRGLYQTLLTRTKEVAEAEQITLPVARIISAAQVPESPIWPKRKLLVVLGGILGGMVGGAIVVGRTALSLVIHHFTPPMASQPRSGLITSPTPPPLLAASGPVAQRRDMASHPAAVNLHRLSRRFVPGLQKVGGEVMAGLLRSLRRYETGIQDRNTRYWRDIETILDRVNFTRRRAEGAVIKIACGRDPEQVVPLSFAIMASRLDERVLLLDLREQAGASGGTPPHRAGRRSDNQDVLSALNIEFVAPRGDRRKYSVSKLLDEEDLESYRGEFDLVIVGVQGTPDSRSELLDTHVVLCGERH